jgi:hypothetical protein
MARPSRFELYPAARVAFRLPGLRWLFAPTMDECLAMLRDLEAAYGGQRRAAEIVGVSVITLQSWKRRKTMSIPSRRLVWFIWAFLLHPERVQDEFDLVTWGRCSAARVHSFV